MLEATSNSLHSKTYRAEVPNVKWTQLDVKQLLPWPDPVPLQPCLVYNLLNVNMKLLWI